MKKSMRQAHHAAHEPYGQMVQSRDKPGKSGLTTNVTESSRCQGGPENPRLRYMDRGDHELVIESTRMRGHVEVYETVTRP